MTWIKDILSQTLTIRPGGLLDIQGAVNGLWPRKTWYVDAENGDDGRAGRSESQAFESMERTLEAVRSGDTIRVAGKIREQLVAPAHIFDVTIIGGGTRPRHADAAPAATGGIAASTWTTPASPTAATPLLKVRQQGWRFVNMLFAGPSDAASILLYRGTDAVPEDEYDASHAEFWNCRFASGASAIEQSGGCGHVGIYDSFFTSLTAATIKHTTGEGIGVPIRWQILNSRFASCPSIMTAVAAQDYDIQGNSFMFASAPTLVFNFTGGARNNVGGRYRNSFNIAAADFDPAGGVTGSGATDVWSNVLTDTIETGLPAN